jgi:hypothetical protein
VRATILGLLLAAGLPMADRALAESCRPQAQDGEAVAIDALLPDGRLRLADGRTLRLAGLDLGSLRLAPLQGREAALVLSGEPDRHGDLRGDLYVEGVSLAESTIREGRGRVRPAPGDGACYATLLRAEEEARSGGLGLWSEPRYAVSDASDPAAVARQEGRFTIVSGRVRHVGTARDRVWIDFGDLWLRDVTLVVPEKERSRFVAAGMEPEALEGRIVRARGVVTLRGGPRIDVTEPAAIERVPE